MLLMNFKVKAQKGKLGLQVCLFVLAWDYHKELLTIEKLKDKRLNEYEEAEKKKDQPEIDELSTLRHNRSYGL